MELKIDLQLFAEAEKTEKPTPKKRKDVREEGQVLQSKEVTSTFILFATFLGIKVFGKYILNYLIKFMTNIYKTIENVDELFYENNLMTNFVKILSAFLGLVAPIIFISFLAALIINYLQVGFIFTTKPLQIKLNRINPIEGLKRLFSKRALMELIKSILKILLIGYASYSFVKKNMIQIMNLQKFEISILLKELSGLVFSFSMRIIGVLIFLSFLDYLFQWREHEKNLMMTKQEIKEEYKQTEGDPLIKSKIREKQRRIAMSRMIQDVPKADVIITNPTHIAIAIKYDKDLYQAPYVLAKGVNIVAENIKKIGKEHSIPLIENKPLARTLYDTVEIGSFIPEELYEAVAEVLAYVYSLKDNY
ncbi:flagellar biosynthesis protein FlhB [Clostridium sp. Cult2]|uniref:flagellar biosynthesis protein FlhB n=1 Tax=Clostridium sp. Cult2 TaxID=2079003 RepID=UPI001F023CC9|nr:flagellar biosynthesis protein FlhB [Clostridium sp. Cult2]MCF6464721.1 flagellar biosynthesis protein FlhB [Clostridium sp. Cult2]